MLVPGLMDEQMQSDHFTQGQHLFNVTPRYDQEYMCYSQLLRVLCMSFDTALTLPNEIRELSVLRKKDKALLYLIFAKDISLGNAEQQGIGNLSSSAGHQNSNRLRLQETRQITVMLVLLALISLRGQV